jgi:hypothetical protein
VSYNSEDGFVTTVDNSVLWLSLSVFIGLIVILEIIAPLINVLSHASENRIPIILMIVSVLIAVLSNSLLPLLDLLNLPQSLRFALADLGFLVYFVILFRYPFLGLYDPSIIRRVMISDKSGVPILILKDIFSEQNKNRSGTLDSGAFISINTILDEIVSGEILDQPEEAIQEFQSGNTFFYFVFRGDLAFIYEYLNPTGVCYSKFKSLSRIFGEESQEVDIRDIEEFIDSSKEYFPKFSAFTEYYQVVN